MRTQLLTAFAALALAGGLAACNGGSNNNSLPPASFCGPSGLQAALVFPNPGSTVSAASTNQVTIAVNQSLPNNGSGTSWNLTFSPNTNPNDPNARETLNALFVVATPPPGSATPSFANPIYEQVNLSSPLSTGTNNVFLDNLNVYCTPIGPIGSFTAQ